VPRHVASMDAGRFTMTVLDRPSRTAAEVAKLSKGSRGRGTARTTGRSAHPMPFPRTRPG
jgi:hypothetical protein